MYEWINVLYFILFKNIYEYVMFFFCKNLELKLLILKFNVFFERYILWNIFVVRFLLGKGEIYKEWNKMIEEIVYYVLSFGIFEIKGIIFV